MRSSRHLAARARLAMLGVLVSLASVGSVVGLSGTAAAQTGPWDSSFDFSRVRLVSALDALDGSGELLLGLEFDIAPGWNIYWRSPGSVGLPPTISWEPSDQILADQTLWPVPDRYTYTLPGEDNGIESMIYRGNPILPVRLEIADPAQPLFARGQVDYMVCNEQCIFGSAQVSLDLFAGDGDTQLSEHAPRINAYLSQVPTTLGDSGGDNSDGVAIPASLSLAAHGYDADAQAIVFWLESILPLGAPDVLVEVREEDMGFVFGGPSVQVADDRLSARVSVPVDEVAFSGVTPLETDFRITLVDDKRGVDVGWLTFDSAQNTANAAGTGAAARGFGPQGWTLLALVLAALAAGAILNFMPCVLPVLSLKLMAFVGKAEQNNREIRTSFLATAAGILVSFWILAALVVGLQGLGVAVGWGFQFQSPWFVSIMAALMVVFAANMFGWFELPNIPGISAVGAGKKGPGADFLTGALATLLATPCSAPLLAPVIGVAFAGSAVTIFALFSLIAVGMAAPYWLVVLFPAIARMMPRPGRWMLILKIVLGALLLGFALFMIWVLQDQLGSWVATTALALSLVVLLGLFALRRRATSLWPAAAGFAALSLAPLASASFLPATQFAWLSPQPGENAIVWRDFDQAQIAHLVAEGNTVFVDVTASWCINCRVNKAVALDPVRVTQAFAERDDLVAMQADWTNHNTEIGEYLASFGRAGIPFNLVYSPTRPDGAVLPAALTPDIVLAALDDGATRAN